MVVGCEKSYLYGIIIGGGKIVHNILVIKFPFRQWGNYIDNPQKAGEISNDLINFLRPKFRAVYNMDFSFEIKQREWTLYFNEYNLIENDLRSYGITMIKKLTDYTDISNLSIQMTDMEKAYFIAGLSDVIGSVNPQHRRFSDDYQIISFEIPGFNYKLIRDLCCILHDLELPTDQILWNHPNMHSGQNPIYKSWKKGNKIRVLTKEFIDNLTFGFRSKTKTAKNNVDTFADDEIIISNPCPDKFKDQFRLKEKSIHFDEGSNKLPNNIRGSHYIHMGHICCAMECPYAPYNLFRETIQSNDIGKYVSYFPVLFKGTTQQIDNYIINSILNSERYIERQFNFEEIKSLFERQEDLYIPENRTSYSINKIIQGAIYLIQIKNGILNGSQTRIIGTIPDFLNDSTDYYSEIINIKIPVHKTPIIFTLNNHSVLIGPNIDDLYQRFITFDQRTFHLTFEELELDDFSP